MEKLTFEQFKSTYRHILSKNSYLHWHEDKDAYDAYLTLPENEFMEKLNERADFHDFGREFYDILREQWNACGALMWEEFEKMKNLGGRDKYIESLRKRIKGFDKYYGSQFGIYMWNKSQEESDDEEDSDED